MLLRHSLSISRTIRFSITLEMLIARRNIIRMKTAEFQERTFSYRIIQTPDPRLIDFFFLYRHNHKGWDLSAFYHHQKFFPECIQPFRRSFFICRKTFTAHQMHIGQFSKCIYDWFQPFFSTLISSSIKINSSPFASFCATMTTGKKSGNIIKKIVDLYSSGNFTIHESTIILYHQLIEPLSTTIISNKSSP